MTTTNKKPTLLEWLRNKQTGTDPRKRWTARERQLLVEISKYLHEVYGKESENKDKE